MDSFRKMEVYEALEVEVLEAVREEIARKRVLGEGVPAALLGVATQLLKAADVPKNGGQGGLEDKKWRDMVSGLPEHLQESMLEIMKKNAAPELMENS